MATIDDKAIIDTMIRNEGYYPGDPRVERIVEYTNAYGNRTWGVVWENEPEHARYRYLEETEYVRNPKILWESRP